MVAERYFYLGLFPLLCAALYGLRDLKNSFKTILISVALIVVSITSVLVNQANLKNWKNDISIWNNVLNQYPNLYFAYMKRGEAYEQSGLNAKAYEDYQSAYLLQKSDPNLKSKLALQAELLGKNYEALLLYDDLLNSKPDAVHFYNRGNVYKKMEQWRKAISDYDSALQLNAAIGGAWNNRGVCNIMLSDTVKALGDFKKASLVEPQNQMFLDNLNRLQAMTKSK